MELHVSTASKSASLERNSDPTSNHESFKCQICKLAYEKTMSDTNGPTSALNSPKTPSEPESEPRIYTISENIFCYFYPFSKPEHKLQKENIFNALLQIKEFFQHSSVKLFCLTETCPEAFDLCNSTMSMLIDLAQPPKLYSILIFCESIFDWLAKADVNRVLLYCQDSISILVLMVYAYSCYYDALIQRDMRISLGLKTFISTNMKYLEHVPVSYRRYGGYMSLYSCMNQLQSLRTSVYLYCLVLYNFPLMESNKERCSQLFFKVYTGDPLVCCHTTKLYCLPVTVNRLVILFDKYPISLNKDSMIVCYHRHISGTKRTKILRLNFHTCQAISDMLTFYCQDFEDLYKGCSVKMKLDLHFRETAVFCEEQCNYVVETSHTELSSVERADSYGSLDGERSFSETVSKTAIKKLQFKTVNSTTNSITESVSNNSASVTLCKESVEDPIIQKNAGQLENPSLDVLNQSGRISGPIDSHHSTKLDTVRTSSTVLNGGSDSRIIDLHSSSSNFGSNTYQARTSASVDREKCNKQLDNLMKDLSLERKFSPNPSRMGANGYTQSRDNFMASSVQQASSVNSTREMQLMTELLEAQKEISNLRRSMNHLDFTDQPQRGFSSTTAPNIDSISPMKFKGVSKGTTSGSSLDSYHHHSTGRTTRKWMKSDNDSNASHSDLVKRNLGFNKTQPTSYSVETQSINEFQESRPSAYSAHRENLERDRVLRESNSTSERTAYQNQTKEREMSDVFEEIETINLQPIGKGIQNLNAPTSPNKMLTKGTKRVESTSHLFSEDAGNLSPQLGRQHYLSHRSESNSVGRFNSDIQASMATLNTGINLAYVEERMPSWYQAQITRDEAIAILRNCSPGSFLIRDSNTYFGAYGLAIKVAAIPQNITLKSDDLESEKVRHYLIEQIGSQGICFKGFPEEPIFPSLSHLVLYYTQTISVLPCQLKLPERPLIQLEMNKHNRNNASNHSIFTTSPKIPTNRRNDTFISEFLVYYLGCYDVEFITGPSVINKAVERLLEHIDPRRYTECQLRINPGEGVVLTDLERKLFFRRNHPFSAIIYCATDPRDRKVELELCKSKGIKKTKIFGIIVRAYIAGENKCFLFGELDPSCKASTIVKSVNQHIQKPNDN